MGADCRGDPASAMLEVLDPEQNKTFRDHYLDLPFDLSKVLFICTANTLDTIPGAAARPHGRDPALRLHRGREARHREALPRPEAARGARPRRASRSRSRTRRCGSIIREYTREAGVRNLERRLADLCRKAARRSPRASAEKIRVDERRVRDWLGPRRFSGEVRKRTSDPGVATGLAYTAVGGDVLFIEATAYPGQGQADDHRPARRGDAGVGAGGALVGARARRAARARPDDWFAEHDVHIHVPAGAVPKDGPSAGDHDGDRDRVARPRRARRPRTSA